MTYNNDLALQNALWTIEAPEQNAIIIGECECCGAEIEHNYPYLKHEDGEYFCEVECFTDHAFKNYLQRIEP